MRNGSRTRSRVKHSAAANQSAAVPPLCFSEATLVGRHPPPVSDRPPSPTTTPVLRRLLWTWSRTDGRVQGVRRTRERHAPSVAQRSLGSHLPPHPQHPLSSPTDGPTDLLYRGQTAATLRASTFSLSVARLLLLWLNRHDDQH